MRRCSTKNSPSASTIVAVERASASPRIPRGSTSSADSTMLISIALTAKVTGVRVSAMA